MQQQMLIILMGVHNLAHEYGYQRSLIRNTVGKAGFQSRLNVHMHSLKKMRCSIFVVLLSKPCGLINLNDVWLSFPLLAAFWKPRSNLIASTFGFLFKAPRIFIWEIRINFSFSFVFHKLGPQKRTCVLLID